MAHVHRKRLEKLVYSDAYLCMRCNVRVGWYYPFVQMSMIQFQYVLSWYSRCLRCGRTERISRLAKRDYIDGFSKSPLSWAQKMMGAPINRCSACRLQYYDWRRPSPEAKPQ